MPIKIFLDGLIAFRILKSEAKGLKDHQSLLGS